MSEMERLEERLRAFGAAPDEGSDWEDVRRRAGGRLWARPARRQLTLVLATVVVVAAAVTGVLVTRGTRPDVTGCASALLWSCPGPSGPSLGGSAMYSIPHDGSNPWGQNGRQITIEELRAEAPYLPLPSSDLANDSNVGTVWVLDHVFGQSVPEDLFAAAVYYPASGVELVWSLGGLGYNEFPTGLVAGVRASLIPGGWSGPTGATGPTGDVGPTGGTGTEAKLPTPKGPLSSTLQLPVGPEETLMLEGPVPESELIDVAQTLSPWPGDASPAGGLPPSNPQPGPDLTFWDGPLSYGVSVGSIDDAAGSLAFRPVAPSSLGKPDAVVETDPAHASASDRVLSLRYDDVPKANYWLVERPSLTTTTSLLREIASDCTRTSGCKDNASTIELGAGVSALKLEDAAVNRIIWVEGGVYYEVIGSSGTFLPRHALSVAKATAAAASG
jgi:hypothetical protein